MWIRLPLLMTRSDTNENGISWVDIKTETIIAIRPFIDDIDGPSESTIIYVPGDNFPINLKPSEVRKILNYEPIKHGIYKI